MSVRILIGDVRDKLRELPDESVHCVVTSPPYYGLRDYGVPGQIGLEPSMWEYIDTMVEVFREVRRVLRSDGTLWLNLGDSYAGSWGAQGRQGSTGDMANRAVADARVKSEISAAQIAAHPKMTGTGSLNRAPGLKAKDLMGVPWRVAFALQEDRWWLRQEIIWAKPNPMPESVRDRCTKAHEHIFLLAKSERYYFDADAISEPSVYADEAKYDNGQNGHGGGISHAGQGSSTRKFRKPPVSEWDYGEGAHTKLQGRYPSVPKSGNKARKPASDRGVPVDTEGRSSGAVAGSVPWEGITRNKRDVWTVPTKPFSEAHFATFPPALIEPCILAGCPEGGTVLDPFFGAGTTGLVCDRVHRDCIGIELNPEYAALARDRIFGDAPLFAEVE